MHVFDFETLAWELISSVKTENDLPAERAEHGFTSAGGKLYVYGGESNNGEW